MSEQMTNCNQCPRGCDLTAPGCGRGERLAAELRGEVAPAESREPGRERGAHGDHGDHGDHGHHGHHGHGGRPEHHRPEEA